MTLRLALAQLAPTTDRQRSLDRALEAIATAAGRGAEIVAFPELAIDRFFPRERANDSPRAIAEPIPGPTTEAVMEAAKKHRVVTVFNLYEESPSGDRYDSSPVIDRDGELLGVVRMAHITQYEHFYEQDYYAAAPPAPLVFETSVGRVGVAICYDRHFPEYMRELSRQSAQLVVIPQAGTIGEWPEGMYEAEVRTAAFQNGYFAALCNRVGVEGELEFSGESFVSDPEGRILARGAVGEEELVLVDLDLSEAENSTAQRLFRHDRRPDLYRQWWTWNDDTSKQS